MTVHVGEVTSEVSAAAAQMPGGESEDPWEEQARMAAVLDRAARDRRRTGTGFGDD